MLSSFGRSVHEVDLVDIMDYLGPTERRSPAQSRLT